MEEEALEVKNDIEGWSQTLGIICRPLRYHSQGDIGGHDGRLTNTEHHGGFGRDGGFLKPQVTIAQESESERHRILYYHIPYDSQCRCQLAVHIEAICNSIYYIQISRYLRSLLAPRPERIVIR